MGLTGFRTDDGRSDGSDPQRRLVEAGTAYRPGVLTDLLLEPGRAYFLQSGALEPHAVTLEMIRPIDPATAHSGDAMPGASQIWTLTPGTETLLRPGKYQTLTTTSTEILQLERVAVDWIQTFTFHTEAAIALANAFGVKSEFE